MASEPLRDEATRRELEDQRAIQFLVEGEIEGVERACGIAEAGLHATPFEQAILPTLQFITHEHRDEVEWGQAFRLRMAEAHVEDVGHAGEAQFAECLIKFGDVHAVAPLRSIRSR